MKYKNIKLSFRDIEADTKDNYHETSELPENFPKHKQQFLAMKPMVDVSIKIDPERKDIERNLAMGINALNALEGIH